MKRFFLTCSCLIAVALSFGCGGTASLSQKNLTIATGSRSGVYFPVGEALARILNQTFKDLQIQVLETEGTVQNLSMLQDGKANLALAQNDLAHYAVQGENMFSGRKIPGISGIATLYSEVVHVLTRRADKINSLSGLKGRKVSVGNENAGTYFNAQQILSLSKVWTDVERINLNPSDSLKAIEKNEIDAFFFTTGLGNPGISELANRMDLSFVPMDPEFVQDLVNAYPYYYPSEIPENTYHGVSSTTSAIEINALLVTNSSLSEEDQYLITRTLFSSMESLKKSHSKLAGISKQSVRRQMTIPLASGAAKAFSENQ